MDEIIKYETAILAKAKGYPQNLAEYHYTNIWPDTLLNGPVTEDPFPENGYTAPTQTSLQRWLREKYDMHLTVGPTDRGRYLTDVYHDSFPENDEYEEEDFALSYEEGVEHCLVFLLNLI